MFTQPFHVFDNHNASLSEGGGLPVVIQGFSETPHGTRGGTDFPHPMRQGVARLPLTCPPPRPARRRAAREGCWWTSSLALTLACPGRGRLAGYGAGNRSLGPGNAPSRPSGHAGVRTGPSGHRLPLPGSGPHAPGPPRSPLGDDPSSAIREYGSRSCSPQTRG